MKGSYRTTAAGILSILAALFGAGAARVQDREPDWASMTAAIMAGIGLLTARDNKVSSEEVGACKKPEGHA